MITSLYSMHSMLLSEISRLEQLLAEKDVIIKELKERCLPDRYEIIGTDCTALDVLNKRDREKADNTLSTICRLPYEKLTLIYNRKSDSFSCEDIVYNPI